MESFAQPSFSINTNNTTEAHLRTQLQDLQQFTHRQHLIIQTLLVLLIEKGLIDEAEFGEWLHYHDQHDGRVDGTLTPSQISRLCTSCGRNNSAIAAKCMYCDAQLPYTVIDPALRKPPNY